MLFRRKIENYFIEWALDGIFSRVACHEWKYYRLMFTRWNKVPSSTEKKTIVLFIACFYSDFYGNSLCFQKEFPRREPQITRRQCRNLSYFDVTYSTSYVPNLWLGIFPKIVSQSDRRIANDGYSGNIRKQPIRTLNDNFTAWNSEIIEW